MSTNTAKAREIEELARQGRIAEAKELAKDKKVEGPKQIPSKILSKSLFIEIYFINNCRICHDMKLLIIFL